MGRKNRKHLANSALPAPAAGAGVGDVAAVRADYEKILACLQRGNHPKALRLMKDALARHGQGSALLLRAHGIVHSRAATVLTDPVARARHHKAALQAAARAVDLAPDSVELAHFRAMLLYDAATDSRAYEDAVAECERGLQIDHPSGPEPHSFRLPAPDPDQLRAELRDLIQKANLASISSWVKTLGGEAERRKATKTPEERRKEIEVQIAALRLMEQMQPNAASSSSPVRG